MTTAEIMGKLVAYTSDQSHSSVERAGLIGTVKMSHVPADEEECMRGDALEAAITQDVKDGLIPFLVSWRAQSPETHLRSSIGSFHSLRSHYVLYLRQSHTSRVLSRKECAQ